MNYTTRIIFYIFILVGTIAAMFILRRLKLGRFSFEFMRIRNVKTKIVIFINSYYESTYLL